MPQAGIALGMALEVSQHLPEVDGAVVTATVAGTIAFELAGPILTGIVLVRSGETKGGS